jgi:uncharacterized protein YgbK (DUF1537 family)
MIKLLILADDLTGSLDTGVQFANCGIETKIITDSNYDFKKVPDNVEVLVIDTETRPLDSNEAYDIIFKLIKRALNCGIKTIYKKTDSALRGNVGSELAAVADAAEKNLVFAPAFPEIGRITLKGSHYVENQLVHESIFGKDPFEPVKNSYVPDIISEQSDIDVKIANVNQYSDVCDNSRKKIIVFDATRDDDLEKLSQRISFGDKVNLLAGCASFANHIKNRIEFLRNNPKDIDKSKKCIVICGSLNPITSKQIDYAAEKGFVRINLSDNQKKEKDYFKSSRGRDCLNEIIDTCTENDYVIVETLDIDNNNKDRIVEERRNISADNSRQVISDNLGDIIIGLIQKDINATYIVTGGDTLMGFVRRAGNPELCPIREIEQGAVVSRTELGDKKVQLISKSGGFGEEDTLVKIAKKVSDWSDVDEIYYDSSGL